MTTHEVASCAGSRRRCRGLLTAVGGTSADVTASIANQAAKLSAGPAMVVDDFRNAVPAASALRPAVSGGVPVLASKITAPGVPDWAVPRPRITELIAQGRRWCPLTVVTGPAGAGKTMALASWAATGPGPVAWVTVDEFDSRPRVFWTYVVAALRRSGVAAPGALPAARGRDAGHRFVLRLAAALTAQDPPVTLVLDDLHLLTDPQAVDELAYVLRNAGPGLRLVVSARMDPPLPLHRYRLAGQLTEILVRRPGVHRRRSRGAPGPARHHADGGLAGVPDPADGGLGGRAAPGRDFDGHSSRPGPVRHRADRRRQRRHRLPCAGGSGPPAA